ncbi:MAG: hypothetical protein Q4A13_07025, partial [Fretibacterium sp.]|nr:hypothetical protein [Fretibacterium sp.]
VKENNFYQGKKHDNNKTSKKESHTPREGLYPSKHQVNKRSHYPETQEREFNLALKRWIF